MKQRRTWRRLTVHGRIAHALDHGAYHGVFEGRPVQTKFAMDTARQRGEGYGIQRREGRKTDAQTDPVALPSRDSGRRLRMVDACVGFPCFKSGSNRCLRYGIVTASHVLPFT